jgi:complement component 1 Q subcomponent-binding protein
MPISIQFEPFLTTLQFDHLDEALQTDFEAFLEERGIDSSLALFIPDLAEYKEQKEYVRWLEGVSKFINL